MRQARTDRGAAAVEFALVLPILVLLVVGMVEFGRAYHYQTMLTGAAREGVRVMALRNDVTAAKTATKNAATGITLTDSQISVTPTTCVTAPSTPTARATVTITYPLPYITGFFGTTVTLTGKGVMRCNG